MTILLGTADGLRAGDDVLLAGHDVNALDGPWALAERQLLFRDGELVIAIGSPAGPRKVTAIIQALLNVFDFGKSMQEAVGLTRIHCEDEPRTLSIEPTWSNRPNTSALLTVAA